MRAVKLFVNGALKQNGDLAQMIWKVPQIIAADFKPHFSVKHMLKDMQIANRMGRHFDLDLTVAGATRDRLIIWPADLPVGSYRLHLTDALSFTEEAPLIVAPPTAFDGDFDRWPGLQRIYRI